MSDRNDSSVQGRWTFATPLATVDVAILAVRGERLEVLLIRRGISPEEGKWALPGGIIDVHRDHDLHGAALRKLQEKTGVATPYLEQVQSTGNGTRDPRGWSVTVLYVALINAAEVNLNHGAGALAAEWFPVVDRGVGFPLAFDHEHLLAAAVERLRNKVEYTALPAHLLPEEFTLTELQRMFEILLQREIEKSAFRRRINEAGVVEPIPGKMRLGSNRPAQLYRRREEASSHYFARNLSAGRRDQEKS